MAQAKASCNWSKLNHVTWAQTIQNITFFWPQTAEESELLEERFKAFPLPLNLTSCAAKGPQPSAIIYEYKAELNPKRQGPGRLQPGPKPARSLHVSAA